MTRPVLTVGFLAAILLFVSNAGRADDLKDFASDGCSAFPDGTREQRLLWQQCCVVHDLAYWLGGSKDERKKADYDLRACVESVGEPTIASLMLAGVRVGGSPWFPTRYRWAYGWPWLRGYAEISADERELVDRKLAAAKKLIEAGDAVADD